MLNNIWFVLKADLEDRTGFGNFMRSFFGLIAKFTYKFFSGAIDLIYDLATFQFIDNQYISSISERIFNILVIFMLFKISLSILNYLVNPDLATDKDKGFQGIIKRVIISIILLISINPIFSLLRDVQDAIINDDIITSIFADSSNSKYLKTDDINLVGIKMNENCPENKYIYTVSSGDRLSLLLLRPFLQPYDESEIKSDSDGEKAWNAVFSESNDKYDMAHYCGYDISNNESFSLVMDSSSKSTQDNIKKAIPGPNSAEGLLRDYYYNLGLNEADSGYFANGDGTTNYYFFDFNYIFAVICGFVALLISISFCFDVVIRSLNLVVLQILAPVPIVSYVSPQGKSSEMLGTWGKKLLSVWASLFIRIICLTLAITLITGACDNISENLKSSNASMMMQIFIVLGILMFAKKLPKLLEELIPGLKLGGFQLNPFKRVKDEALGGKFIGDTVGRGIGFISGGVGGTLAGLKAGREIGATGKGAMLGFMSGASNGFRNKKWSLGTGMNESYKNLTGSEFRRLTPTTLLLPKMGAKPVQEAKDYIKDAYSQLNSLNSDLNISENLSSSLAQNLMTKGYNVRNTEESKKTILQNIDKENERIRTLNLKVPTLDYDKNQSVSVYNQAKTNYDNAVSQHQLLNDSYENSVSSLESIKKQILEEEKKLSNSSMIGSFAIQAQDRINALKNQKLSIENTMANNKDALDNSKLNLDNLKTNLDTAELNMNQKMEEYNNNNLMIQEANERINGYNNDIKEIEKFEKYRSNEEEIRKKISEVEKDIDTLKKEKSQRERFYRIDPAPQQDYSTAKRHVDDRKNS